MQEYFMQEYLFMLKINKCKYDATWDDFILCGLQYIKHIIKDILLHCCF